jgi:hypothetical protein
MSASEAAYCCECNAGPYNLEYYKECLECGRDFCGKCHVVEIPDKTSASTTYVTQTQGYTSRASIQLQTRVFGSSPGQEIPKPSHPMLHGRKSSLKVFTGLANCAHVVRYCCQCGNFDLDEVNPQCSICGHEACSNCPREEAK